MMMKADIQQIHVTHPTGGGGGVSAVKKCSRCRVKRNESESDLMRYATCSSCRTKRKIERQSNPEIITRDSTVYSDYGNFINKIKLNSQIDIFDHKFISFTPSIQFKRYSLDEVTPESYSEVSKQLIHSYIHPLMDVTGFRFPVRDYHKGGSKTRKISFMFICSQDRSKQRKSRSNDKRNIQNKLKVQDCCSKINLNYDLVSGKIQLIFTHKHHEPYMWKKERNSKYDDLSDVQHYTNHHHHLSNQQNDNSPASNALNNLNFYQATAAELSNLNNYIKQSSDDLQHNQLSLPMIVNEINVENIDHELIRESLEMDKKKLGL